jgi:putative CocE/NonD family hydrolase
VPESAQPRTRRARLLDALTARLLRMPPGRVSSSVTRAVPIPMRDGVVLLADIYTPEHALGTLLIRTPYGRSGTITHLTARYYASHGYRVVNQSCRGTSGSGGVFQPFSQEIDDGADTVAWLRDQEWFGGRFAAVGASYLGWAVWALLMNPPPELATAVISIAALDNYRVAHGKAAFSLETTLGLFDGFAGVLKHGAGLAFYLSALTAGRRLQHGFNELPLVSAQETVLAGSRLPYREWLTTPDPADPLWRPMQLGPALDRVEVPVLLQDGWQDLFPDHMIDAYAHLHRRGVDVALTVGPWTHVDVVTKGAGVIMEETLDWLGEHFAGTGPRHRPTPVRIFVTGAQEWRYLAEWPPPTEDRVLYLQPDDGLDEAQPASDASPSTFIYDPANPTPGIGGQLINPARGGYRDNRKIEERADVLTFTTQLLSEALEVIGLPVVELVHATDNPHADLFVRICEVQKSGRSINVSDGFRRLKPPEANGIVRLALEAMAHRFMPGTRIRLQVSGGSHPRYARNLGTDQDPASSTEFAPSRRTIYHGDGGFSRLVLPSPSTGRRQDG